ncbi:MAG: HlyD family efflux transporter periplasmic adaptor subunit, partial [Candidatus Nanopelagicales bacterium]
LCLIVVGVLVWAIFGRAPQTVTGFGYVVPEGGYTEVGARVSGLVDSVNVEAGQRVSSGEELVRVNIVDGDSSVESLVSPVDGIVSEVVALPGRVTAPGDPMIYLQPDDAPLVVKGFIPATSAGTIRIGMPAEVTPADAPRRAQYGVILGTVTALSPTPATADRISFIVGGNSSLVDYFLSAGPVIEATVELKLDPATPSGYAWSIGQGPDVEVRAGTLSEVTVVLRDTPVIGWFTQ